MIAYFQELEEESIRDNFVLIYELLDEIMDHGYPQITDHKMLKEVIKTSSNKMSIKEKKEEKNISTEGKDFTGMSSRVPGIKYKTNKAFLDVVEEVNSLVRISKLYNKLNFYIFINNYLKFRFLVMVQCLDQK